MPSPSSGFSGFLFQPNPTWEQQPATAPWLPFPASQYSLHSRHCPLLPPSIPATAPLQISALNVHQGSATPKPLTRNAEPAEICSWCGQRCEEKNRAPRAKFWGRHVHPKTMPNTRVRTLRQMMKVVSGWGTRFETAAWSLPTRTHAQTYTHTYDVNAQDKFESYLQFSLR